MPTFSKWVNDFIPPEFRMWTQAIIQQESGGNPYAWRYEPTYKWLYKVEEFAKHPQISMQTEMIGQRISWGLGQIMGALAREQGHTGLLSELFIPEINLKHMLILLTKLKKKSSYPPDVFAMYNGGESAIKKINGKYSNQTYVDSVMRHLQNLMDS